VSAPPRRGLSLRFPDPRVRRTIRRNLLRWYDLHGRDLPWRRRPREAYAQWVAEIMLQQTQVDTVIPYYQRFMRRFPTVRELAAASDDHLLQEWQGLGYYRRAANLHKAAQLLASNGGDLPDTVEELIELPGIGRYTAGAIASIAFGRRAAAVDGNLARVLARLFAIRADVSLTETMRQIWRLAETILPYRRCGDFNQALMDLGANVCTPTRPRCHRCPLRHTCAANIQGITQHIPYRPRRPAVPQIRRVVAVVESGGRLLAVKRPPGGLWGGLWEFPNIECPDNHDTGIAAGAILSEFGIQPAHSPLFVGRVPHRLTHRLIHFDIIVVRAEGGRTGPRPRNVRWITPDSGDDSPMSVAMRKIWRLVRSADALTSAEPDAHG